MVWKRNVAVSRCLPMEAIESPVALLQELIRIPSVNPDGAPDEDAAGERECAEWVGRFLEGIGATVTFEEVLPGRPNVIGRFPSTSSRRGLVLAPHTDTVSVRGMTIDPFGGEISDGKIYGRGASDTKGTMAAMLWALHLEREAIPGYAHPIAFAGMMGEEASQPGSRHFAANHADEFSFALVGEPTELETVYANKGCVWIELSTTGKSCHGSTPERGENAIRKLIPILEPLLRRIEERLPQYADDILGLPTVSLGKIEGGTSPNIVPSSCRVVLDFRETPALHEAGGSLGLVRELLPSEDAEIAAKVLGESSPLLTDTRHPGVERLESIGSRLTTAPWFCDAGRFAECGLASVACGPGKIAQAHTKDEYLSIADLEAGVAFYRRFLRTWAE
ncbi:MAG: M20/M25/M40 family metallo-hydrolase [Verrucomicrobiota bacterium]